MVCVSCVVVSVLRLRCDSPPKEWFDQEYGSSEVHGDGTVQRVRTGEGVVHILHSVT